MVEQPDSMTKMENEEAQSPMAIAIIGMGCRFPGGATSLEKLWELCVESRSAWSPVPPDRFNMEAFYDANNDRSGTVMLLNPPIRASY